MHYQSQRYSIPLALAPIAMAIALLCPAAAEGATPAALEIRVGCFVDRANESDPELVARSMSEWLSTLLPLGEIQVSATIENDNKRWRKAVADGRYDLYSMYAYQFLDYPQEHLLTPAFTTTGEMGASSTFLLITRRSDKIDSIAGLRDKSIVVDTGGFGELPLIWLATEIATACPPREVRSFASISSVQSPLHALFPVYFGKADACIISRHAFAAASLANREIVSKLSDISHSAPLLVSLFAFQSDFPAAAAEKITSLAVAGSTSTSTRKLLELLHRDGLATFRPSALANVATLQSKYRFIFDPQNAIANSKEGEPE